MLNLLEAPAELSKSNPATGRTRLFEVKDYFSKRSFPQNALLGWIACILMVTAILYWRRPDAFSNPQLWAEDGNIFFTDAFFKGARALFLPYSGYYHTLARVAALIGRLFPVRYVPYWYAFSSWLVVAAIVGYIFSERLSFTLPSKFLLGLAIVATTANNEVFGNLANWATLMTLFWLLLAISNDGPSRRQSIFDCIILVLTGLNSPFTICLWPLFLFRWWQDHTSHRLRLAVLSCSVALIQIANMSARVQKGGILPAWNWLYADALIYRFGFMFLGEQIFKLQLTNMLRVYGVLIVLGFYSCLFWQAIVGKNRPQFIILSGGVMVAMVSFYVMRHAPLYLINASGRHFFIPAVTLAWVLILANPHPWFIKWIPLAMMFGAFLFLTPQSKNQVFPDLDWGGHTARCVGTQPLCKIPINPVWNPPAWFAFMDAHTFVAPTMQTSFYAQFDNKIELLGYSVVQQPAQLNLTLGWRSAEKMKNDYKFFVHFFTLDNPTKILAQTDAMPLHWQYPTSKWITDEIITEQITFPLHSLPAGQYQIAIGWYDPNTSGLARLTAYNAQRQQWPDNRVVLPQIIMIPPELTR